MAEEVSDSNDFAEVASGHGRDEFDGGKMGELLGVEGVTAPTIDANELTVFVDRSIPGELTSLAEDRQTSL